MKILLIALTVIIVAVILNACSPGSDYSLNERSFTPKHLRLIETNTGLSFPDRSRGLNMFYKGSQIDPSFVAKVEIPAAAEAMMVAQIERCTNSEFNVKGSLSEGMPWWKPSKTTIRMERQCLIKGAYLHIILCKENDVLVLYLDWISI